MTPPKVSAVIPAYDGERHVAQAIESVLAQTYAPVEIIVVDDGSRDGTAAIVRSFPGVKLVARANGGVSAARNEGVRHATGSLLAFLDQDDRWTPEKLRLQVAALGEVGDDPPVDYVLGHQRLEVEPGVREPAWLRNWSGPREHLGYFPGTLVVRREAFERTGGFRPGAEPAEGADWFLRANECGLTKRVVPDVVLIKRVHDRNQSADTALVRQKMLAAFRGSVQRRRARVEAT